MPKLERNVQYSPPVAPGITDHFGLTNIGVNTHVQIDSHIADSSIHFTEGSIDHGNLLGLGDDDHSQYALLAGRAGGQVLIGGTAGSNNLTLQANTIGGAGTSAGRIHMNQAVEFNSIAATSAAYAFNYNATENYTAGFVGGGLNMSGNITFNAGTFIYESFRGAPTITTAANPGFAAYTVLQALPQFNAGSGAGHNPLSPLILNCGPTVRNSFVGSRTTGSIAAINFAPVINPSVNGAIMNITNITGLTFAPKWSTVTGSRAEFGTMRGLHCINPAQGLFGGSNGIERGTAYYGVDFENITLPNAFGTMPVAAVRSTQNAGTNKWFLLNGGSAHSNHGNGHMYFNDNRGIAFGSLGLSYDAWIRWNAPSSTFAIQFQSTLDDLYLSSPSANTFLMSSNANSDNEMAFDYKRFAFGQAGIVGNQVGLFVANARSTGVNGGWADFLLTQAGNLTINHTMDDVAAWVINPISLTAGTGSISGHVAGISVGQTNSGLMGAPTYAILQRGRRHTQGVDSHEHLIPAQITSDQNDYQPYSSSTQRQVMCLDSDAARNITGFGVQQTEDTLWLVNVGSFNITLQHQNVGSAAGNRIISPSGVDYVLGPDESCLIMNDSTASRWRILWGTGA